MNPVHFHPMLVHFPIALAMVALLFDLSAYYFRKTEWISKATTVLTILAALGAIASLISGLVFTKPVAGLAASMKDIHLLYAAVTTTLLVISACIALYISASKKAIPALRYLLTLFLVLSAVGIALTGFKGGSIVYDVWLF